MKAHKLLHQLRLDILAKHAYARLRDQADGLPWAQKIYSEHILAMNSAYEKSPPKNDLADFYDSYHKILSSFAQNGWGEKQKSIPVAVEDPLLILNGGHRVAACLLNGIDAPTRLLEDNQKWRPPYNYEWLASRGLSTEILDYMALEYVQLRPDCRMAIVWPAAAPHINLIESVFKQNCTIIYRKKLRVNGNVAVNIVRQIYAGEKWIDHESNQFKGVLGKARNSVAGGKILYCYVLQADPPNTTDKVKQKARAKTKMENDAMHTTDTQDETLRAAKMFFNENSIHFLHYAIPNQSPEFVKRLGKYQKATADQDNFAIHGSGVMEAYGIRTAKDLDYISTGDKLKMKEKISLDNDKVKYCNLSLNELLYDPRNYFYYNGVKFVSLQIVKQMKQLRNETKDIADVKLIDDHIDSMPNKFVFEEGVGNLNRHKWVLVPREKFDRRKKREQKMRIAVVVLTILLIALLTLLFK